MNTLDILEQVKKGSLSLEEAAAMLDGPRTSQEADLSSQSYIEMDFAKLDSSRKARTGFPEVVYCKGKPDDFLVSIYRKMLEEEGEVFGTRADARQYQLIKAVIPDISYDPVSHILKKEKAGKVHLGGIAVCSAGTADIPVAEEAAQTAEFFGTRVHRIYDVGVSGIHRLLSKMEILQKANCLVAVAGMEGALPLQGTDLADTAVEDLFNGVQLAELIHITERAGKNRHMAAEAVMLLNDHLGGDLAPAE